MALTSHEHLATQNELAGYSRDRGTAARDGNHSPGLGRTPIAQRLNDQGWRPHFFPSQPFFETQNDHAGVFFLRMSVLVVSVPGMHTEDELARRRAAIEATRELAEMLERPQIMITEPGVYQVSTADYLADPTPDGSLSVSGARQLLPPSCPALYHHWRTQGERHTRAFDEGKAAHHLVLGDGPELVEVPGDWRTIAAKSEVEDARACGAIPLHTESYQQVQEMAAAIRAHPVAARLFDPDHGKPEQSLFWKDAQYGFMRRARLDWLPERQMGGRLILPEYKTALAAHPETWARKAVDYGYDMQCAWYLEAARALELGPDPGFLFVVQEKTEPYLVSLLQLDTSAIERGQRRNRRALEIYAECTRTDTWPGYTDDEVELVSLPAWASWD